MTKEKLSQYYSLLKEREELEKRIEKIKKKSNYIADRVQNGYKRHLAIFGYDISKANKLHELQDILIEREAMIIIEQVEIEKYINTIKDSKTRRIFTHRYIENMDWYQVAQIMGYSGESAPRMRHDRYLEENL